jgi:hypothetical protein
MDGTITVLKSRDGLLHFPTQPANPAFANRLTRCGLLADHLEREERPVTWAGVWCSRCLERITKAPRSSS